MKVFLVFIRFTFICNICFILFIFFRWQEHKKSVLGISDKVLEIPYFKDLIIVLGFAAIFINLLMNLVCILLVIFQKINLLSKWILFANFLFLILQIGYFFYN